jgi:hypothetical protein
MMMAEQLQAHKIEACFVYLCSENWVEEIVIPLFKTAMIKNNAR